MTRGCYLARVRAHVHRTLALVENFGGEGWVRTISNAMDVRFVPRVYDFSRSLTSTSAPTMVSALRCLAIVIPSFIAHISR